jgi:homoserine kinase
MNMSCVLQVDQSNLQMASVVCFLYLYSTMMMEEPGIVPMEIWVESDIPLGAGLGSSAALSVCLAAGLMAVRHQVQVPFHFFPDVFFGSEIHKEKMRRTKLSHFGFARCEYDLSFFVEL